MTFKREKLLDRFLFYMGIPLFAIYFFSMFVYPFIAAWGSWNYIQNVWDRWQSLNVGVLAFGASIIAFNISRYKEARQRDREFQAAIAFLPEALSELTLYFRVSAKVYESKWKEGSIGKLSENLPLQPEGYRSVFGNCIRHARPEVGEYLSRILTNLQIHHSRVNAATEENDQGYNKEYILSCLCRLGELQALVNPLFDFARGIKEFDSAYPDIKAFRSAFSSMKITVENFQVEGGGNLETTLNRFIEKSGS